MIKVEDNDATTSDNNDDEDNVDDSQHRCQLRLSSVSLSLWYNFFGMLKLIDS